MVASYVDRDGSAWLSSEDLMTVLAALQDASWFRSVNPGDDDRALSVRYQSLRYRLGDDR